MTDLAAPKIKKLVWDVREIPKGLAGGFWATTVSAFGSYEVHMFLGHGQTIYLQTPSYGRVHKFETVEAAKAAAQTDYERRIMECLE